MTTADEKDMKAAYRKILNASLKIQEAEQELRRLGLIDEWTDIHDEHSFGEAPGSAIRLAVEECLEERS